MLPSWCKECGVESFSPGGRDVDAALIAAGFVRKESGIEYQVGPDMDITLCRATYTRGKSEKVFIITNEKGGPASGGAA
ncbi:hypothetical protein FACS1894137_11830 [Spirochaetia bacterium]|nr:hypothetical protein FACS1894137_11830 [Spirochaetia bacterium]